MALRGRVCKTVGSACAMTIVAHLGFAWFHPVEGMQHSEASPVPARQNSLFWMSATSRMVIGRGIPNGGYCPARCGGGHAGRGPSRRWRGVPGPRRTSYLPLRAVGARGYETAGVLPGRWRAHRSRRGGRQRRAGPYGGLTEAPRSAAPSRVRSGMRGPGGRIRHRRPPGRWSRRPGWRRPGWR